MKLENAKEVTKLVKDISIIQDKLDGIKDKSFIFSASYIAFTPCYCVEEHYALDEEELMYIINGKIKKYEAEIKALTDELLEL